MKKVLKITLAFLILIVTLLLLSTASNAANINLNEDGYTTPEELLTDMASQSATSLILEKDDNLIIGGITYIGSNGMLQINEGQIVITYDSEEKIITLTISGEASTTSDADYIFYMRKWSNGTVEDTTPMNITVSIGSTLNINCGEFEVCDTSVLTVEDGGIVNISENSNVTVAEQAQITGSGTLNINGTLEGAVADSLTVNKKAIEEEVDSDDETATDSDDKYYTPFSDVSTSAWYYKAVEYCYTNKIILGFEDSTFRPGNNITRGQFVTILWRMEGEPDSTSSKSPYSDLSSSSYYYDAVLWAAENGVVNGYKDGTFKADESISRQQIVVILKNYADYKDIDTSNITSLDNFADSESVTDYAVPAMQWAAANGVINGKTSEEGIKYLDPSAFASRAQAAGMVYNYCTEILE